MDINLLRIIVTVTAFVAFLGIVWWAYTPSRRRQLEDHGRAILDRGDA